MAALNSETIPVQDKFSVEEAFVGYFFCQCWQDAIDFDAAKSATRREVSLLDTGAVLVKSDRQKRFYSKLSPSSRSRLDNIAAQHHLRRFSGDRRFFVSK